MTPRTISAWAAALLFAAPPAFAHDYWLGPETYFPAAGAKVTVRLHVGDHFKSEAERPFQKKPTVRFELIGAKGKQDLAAAGKDGEKPAAQLTAKEEGNYLIVLERGPQTIKLDADKFNAYLAEEGLDAIRELRRQSGQDKAEGRERYQRYIKCLLQCGDKGDDTFKKEVGQRLEIVPQENPYRLKAGERLTVKVLFDGKPLAGVRLFAHHRAGEKVRTQTLDTSKDGLATIKLEQAGQWLIRLVHMRRCEGDKDVDWESFWGALTFGLK